MINRIEKFFERDSSVGIMCIAVLLFANSSLNEIYNHLLEPNFSFCFSGLAHIGF